MSLLSELFSKTPSVQDLQDRLKEIDLEQRKKRRELAMLEEAKQQKVKRAVDAKKAGRQELLRDIFRDVSQVEIDIGNANSDLRRISLTRTALSSFARKAEWLEKKKDRKRYQELLVRFNDSSIRRAIDSASVDDDTFNSMLEDVLGEEEISAVRGKEKEDHGFADFDKAIGDMARAEDAGTSDEDLAGLRQPIKGAPLQPESKRVLDLRPEGQSSQGIRIEDADETSGGTQDAAKAAQDAAEQQKDNWKIAQDTQNKIHEIEQDVTKNKAKTEDKMFNNSDEYIRG